MSILKTYSPKSFYGETLKCKASPEQPVNIPPELPVNNDPESTTYEEDILNGPSKVLSEDSIIFCNYINDLPEGDYRIYIDYATKANETLYGDTSKAFLMQAGLWAGGLKTGRWLMYDKKKRIVEEATYQNGLLHGIKKQYFHSNKAMCVSTYENNNIQTETFYDVLQEGFFTGVIRTYSEKLVPQMEISVKNGKRSGLTKEYDKNGIMVREVNYIDGEAQ